MTIWTVHALNNTVDDELEALPVDIRSKFVRISGLLEQFGPQNVGMPHIRSLGDKFWEIRVSGRGGIARGIYLYAKGKKIIVLHVFIKKTQKTPLAALEMATRRAKQAKLI
ncbi:MAG: type II toxin-antitoxin system RelE/ParE family toxin [Rhodoferax sp.]|nr:type II toxin-antitoxin system RelE/ParE family toxin [Rhodoferax sp.]MCF8190154.1 type II toxin-antitoxin system RelE/ParE family toxin [Polynucleobacter sp.]